jgi:hypothetical protein
MPTFDDKAELFKKHLGNPNNPGPTLSLLKDSQRTAQFFAAFIASGDVTALQLADKIQLLAMLGVWCPADAPKLLESWISLESDADLRRALQMRLRTFTNTSRRE